MVADFYEISVVNDSTINTQKMKNILAFSYILKVLAFIFVFLGIAYSKWWLSVFFIMYGSGIVFRQMTLEMTAFFTYTYVKGELVISKTNNLNKIKIIARILPESIIGFEKTFKTENLLPYEYSIEATDKAEKSVLYFVEDGHTNALFFSPDDYLTALLENK